MSSSSVKSATPRPPGSPAVNATAMPQPLAGCLAYHCAPGRFINATSGECYPWNIRLFDEAGHMIYTIRWYEGRGWVRENLSGSG